MICQTQQNVLAGKANMNVNYKTSNHRSKKEKLVVTPFPH